MYPSFNTNDELFAWLRSPAGGNLMVREFAETSEYHTYAIIYYKKGVSNMSLPHVRASRSVIWDKVYREPVLVSPAHGFKFRDATPETTITGVYEFVDGVMVNMFFSGRLDKWVLATRTNLGGTNHYYGTRSFAELFWEAFDRYGFKETAEIRELFDPNLTYSWVLQHPDERIVVRPVFGLPQLTLVSPQSVVVFSGFKACLPLQYPELTTLEQIKEFVVAEGKRRGASWQGVVFYDDAGNRYKLRSDEYDTARCLRGNQAKRPYVWLERWSEGRLPEYLRLFPEEEHDANEVVDSFKACTQELYNWYQKVYREHKLPLGQVPQKFRKLVWESHAAHVGSYFPSLIKFMNKQDTARKLWLVNFERRYEGVTGVTV